MKGLPTNLYLFVFILLFGTIGCKNGNQSNGAGENPLTFNTLTANDTLSIKLHYLGDQKVYVKYSVDFPESYIDDENTVALNKLFYTEILGCDSANFSSEKVLQNILKNYTQHLNSSDSIFQLSLADSLNLNEANLTPEKILSEISVKPIFNSDTILSVCKSRMTKNNDDKPLFEHIYYNVDLQNMRLIELNDLFEEESLSLINQMLKDKLLAQNNVKNEDELIQLGYFNLDNLFAGNNFYINDKGITWNFLPLEISCFNIGETEIFLSYADLSPLMSDIPSLISKYIVI